MSGLVCVCILIVGFGLLQIFAPDLMWGWTERSNQLAGRQSERTELWDTGRVIGGVVTIILGIVLGLWGLSADSQNASRDAAATLSVQSTELAGDDLVVKLDADFASVIPVLLERATTQSQRIPADLDGSVSSAVALDFGRCESDGTFYMYVLGYRQDGGDYAYSTGSLCRHSVLSAGQVETLGESNRGGTWYWMRFMHDTSSLATNIFKNIPTAVPSATPLATPTN